MGDCRIGNFCNVSMKIMTLLTPIGVTHAGTDLTKLLPIKMVHGNTNTIAVTII